MATFSSDAFAIHQRYKHANNLVHVHFRYSHSTDAPRYIQTNALLKVAACYPPLAWWSTKGIVSLAYRLSWPVSHNRTIDSTILAHPVRDLLGNPAF